MKSLIGATLCVLALGCTSPSTSTTADADAAADAVQGGREVDGHVLPPIENMSDVMLAKLAHTQAIIEGISVSNFDQIRLNAVDLFEISKKTEWMVQDTVTYTVLSEDFRQAVTALADDAGAGNTERVKDDFFRVTETCIDCHAYLRRERRFKEMPGEVSERSAPALLDRVTIAAPGSTES
jgi:hypothetical protein